MPSNLETTASLDQLPLEVLHVIFNHIDIPDILRIRRVSRYLNEATNYRTVWVNAYRTSELVCPPGPFPFQTVHDLEKVLVTSFRIHRNLRHSSGTAQTEKLMLKRRIIWYTDQDLDVSLVFGRFLFVAFEEEVRYYDLTLGDSHCNSNPNTIYRTTGGIMTSFHCVSATDIEGHPFACVVLDEAMQETRRTSIYLLNVGERSEVTLDLLHQFEHHAFFTDTVNLGPRVIVIQGLVLGDGFDSGWRLVALDVHTRTQFLLPSFTHATWGAAEVMPERELVKKITVPKSISTSTHLVLARSFYTEATGWSTFFQAFALPTTHTHHYPTVVSTHLDPSHQGIIPGISVRVGGTLLLHDAVLDSPTQDVLIAIRVRTFCPRTSQHGILRLGTIHGDREFGTITFQLLGPFFNHRILRPCFNGTSRVFYIHNKDVVAALEYNLHASRNEVDGGAKVVKYPCVLQFATQRTLLDYDPYFGRICLRFAAADFTAIEILDLSA